jgi:hypothetical protein
VWYKYNGGGDRDWVNNEESQRGDFYPTVEIGLKICRDEM